MAKIEVAVETDLNRAGRRLRFSQSNTAELSVQAWIRWWAAAEYAADCLQD